MAIKDVCSFCHHLRNISNYRRDPNRPICASCRMILWRAKHLEQDAATRRKRRNYPEWRMANKRYRHLLYVRDRDKIRTDINQKFRERYANDPAFREHVRAKNKIAYQRRKRKPGGGK